MLKSIRFVKFTVFEDTEVCFSPGINVFLGENGTGKTHILKAAYSACEIGKPNGTFAEKLVNVFYPSEKRIGRLVKRSSVSSNGSLEIVRTIINNQNITLRLKLSNHTTQPDKAIVSGTTKLWRDNPVQAVYIPVKDMMANAPGFRSLYEEREIHFEEVYVDVLRKAFLPFQKGPIDANRKKLLSLLQDAMDGKVIAKNEELFLKNKQGELEFTLLAEGLRKIGLLWMLIQNRTLLEGSILFWDEPEANLNPKLMRPIVEILIELQRMGIQIFVATHDYVFLNELNFQIQKSDRILYHTLYRKNGEIECSSTDNFSEISPNAIDDTFGDLIDRDIEKKMGGFGK